MHVSSNESNYLQQQQIVLKQSVIKTDFILSIKRVKKHQTEATVNVSRVEVANLN